MSDIPRQKGYKGDAVQCDACHGHGCGVCEYRGWHADSQHPAGRHCEREGCDNIIPPHFAKGYCSQECAEKSVCLAHA